MSKKFKKCKYCEKPATRLGMCTTHYFRMRRTGDPLLVRDKWTSKIMRKGQKYELHIFTPSKSKKVICKIDKEDAVWVNEQTWRISNSGQIVNSKGDLVLGRYILHIPKSSDNTKAVFHINEDEFDFRRKNLTLIPMTLTRAYRPKHKKYRGVYPTLDGKKSYAKIFCNRKQYYLGAYDTEEEAAEVYNDKAIELYGPLAILNDVEAT